MFDSSFYPDDGGLRSPVRDFRDVPSLYEVLLDHFGVRDILVRAMQHELKPIGHVIENDHEPVTLEL